MEKKKEKPEALGSSEKFQDNNILASTESGKNIENDDQKKTIKSYSIIFILSICLGFFGAHRFYTGRIKSGLIQLITLGCFGIWTLIDVIMILSGKYKDKSGNPIPNPKPAVYWSIFAVICFIYQISPDSSSTGGSQTGNTSSTRVLTNLEQK